MEDVVKMIGKGRSGWHASGISRWGTFSSSSYDRGDEQMAKYAAQAEDGALVYDASKAGPEFETMVISGPMFDPRLPPDGVDRFTQEDRRAAARMIPALQGSFKEMARAALREGYTGLDKVGSGVYEAILRAISGVRIGHVAAGKVVWDEDNAAGAPAPAAV